VSRQRPHEAKLGIDFKTRTFTIACWCGALTGDGYATHAEAMNAYDEHVAARTQHHTRRDKTGRAFQCLCERNENHDAREEAVDV
jgi:hypothetical protein